MSSEADYWTGYTIYRSTTGTSYSKVATIANKLAASWIDYSFSSGSMLTVYYKMVADNGERKSNFTSIQSINVLPSKKSSESKKIEFILEQNYPNPFNPITVITYSIPSDEFVQLKVYDLIGKEVTELVSQHLKAGVHSVIYDASNQSAGIYIYSIKAGNYTQSKKLIFMK